MTGHIGIVAGSAEGAALARVRRSSRGADLPDRA